MKSPPREEAERLTIELEAALLRELAREWHRLNDSHFKRSLVAPTFLLSDVAGRLGRFDPESRVLELSRRLALREPWLTVVEVLRHEMAHQYVLEVLKIDGESAHGPAFRDVCRRLGIDPRASGVPESAPLTGEEDRVLARIAKLLALAESPSAHEAETAMKLAQRLMLKYNLEQASLPRSSEGQAYSFRTLGTPTGRVSEAERTIANILSEHFFVEVIWVPVFRPLLGKRGSVLEISGTPANLDMASYVYAFLMNAGARLWEEHRRAEGIRGNRDRRTYLAGVMSGFFEKLKSEKKAQEKQGLVWLGDAELRGFYKKRHPHVVTVRYGTSSHKGAHAHGREAGKRLVLHRPIGAGPSGGPKLLRG